MKKLMFAVAVVTAGIAFADVTSANIVGYAGNGLRVGATMVTPQFIGLNNSSNDLQSLIPTGSGVLDVTEIKVLDDSGRGIVDQDYIWTDLQYLDVKPVPGIGWAYNDYSVKAEGVFFAPGQGLWIYGQNGQGIQSAGQVEQVNDAIVNLRVGATGCGNPYPVAINLQDILPEGDGILDVVEIKVLDDSGRGIADQDYIWTDCQYLDVKPVPGIGWAYNDYSVKAEGVQFDPGQGLWVYGQNGQKLRFPVPESIQAK